MNQTNPQSTRTIRFNAAGPITQLLSLLIILALIVIGFAIAIPLIIGLAALFLVFYIYVRIKLWLNRTRAPNGPLDGRRNVRVIKRDE